MPNVLNKIRVSLLSFLLLLVVVTTAFGEGKKEEEHHSFDIAEIMDAHSFHIIGSLHMPLPVILKGEYGWSFFMSSAFHHDNNGEYVLDKNGDRYVLYKEKVYFASNTPNEQGQYLEFDEENNPTNAMPLDLSISKIVFTMFMSVTVLCLIFISIARSYKKNKGRPRGLASFLEPIIILVRDQIAKPNLKGKYEQFMPYLLTVFFFIWINNIIGLLPIFPIGGNVTGNIAVTMVLAVITFVITTVKGNKGYWKHIFNTPGVPWWLKFPVPLIPVIEFIGIFAKPFSLTVRLFANITAGHILVGSLLFFPIMFQSYIVGGASTIFMLFILAIEILVGFLQAFIFTILSSLYIGLAVEDEHH